MRSGWLIALMATAGLAACGASSPRGGAGASSAGAMVASPSTSAQIRSDPSSVVPLLTGPTGAADLTKSLAYERFAGTLVGDALDVLEQEEPWRAGIDGRSPRTRAELAGLIDDGVVKEAAAM